MPKFSIIIPVYNVENYLEKCLDSVLRQSYTDYEVIVVNDGSTDSSLDIINEYVKKIDMIKLVNQENQGLSMARNNGIKEARGEYLLFLDSDDYIDEDLLLNLSNNLYNDPDLVRFNLRVVDNDNIIEMKEESFNNLNGVEAFKKIVNFKFVENAWTYLYKTSFYKENNFNFEAGVYHEDYGLIPYIIIKAKVVNAIEYTGYNYVQRDNSIMNNNNYPKTVKKAYDVLFLYKKMINLSDDLTYKSFLANSLIIKLEGLDKEDYNKFLKELKKERVFDNVLADTLPRKIKRLILKINPKMYLKMR